MVYGLGNKGATLLASDFQIPRTKVDWTSKNREIKSVFLYHTLAIAHFMVCLEVALKRTKEIRLIEPEEIIDQAPTSRRNKANPFSFKVETFKTVHGEPRRVSFGVVPDKLFGLHFTELPRGRNKAYFFLEADRATMPVKRRDLLKTSFYKNMLGYYLSSPMKDNNLFEKTFGFKHARVLTITKSQDRIKSMLTAGKEVDDRGRGVGMFLFAEANSFNLEDPTKLLDKIWINGRQEVVSLVD